MPDATESAIFSSREELIGCLCWTLKQVERKKRRESDYPPPPTGWRLWASIAALVLCLGFILAQWWGMLCGVPRPSVDHGSWFDAVGRGGKPLWTATAEWTLCGLVFAALLPVFRKASLRRSWRILREIRPLTLAQNAGVLAAVVGAATSLERVAPWLDRSWLYLLPGHGDRPMNLLLLPAHVPWLSLLFIPLLILNVPLLAESEEESYRKGTRDWKQGAWRSLRFGLAHCGMGVPLYIGLALSLGGLWFTRQYLLGGVKRATAHHTAYNLLAVAFLTWTVIHAHLTR